MTREFIILPEFERNWIAACLSEEDLRKFQIYLCKNSFTKATKEDLNNKERQELKGLVGLLKKELERNELNEAGK